MKRSWIANKQFKREYLPEEDINKLYNACVKWKEKFFLSILHETGMRVGELANMKKDDVDFNDKIIRVYGKGGIYGTESKFRVIPLSPTALDLLTDFFRHHENEPRSARTIEHTIAEIKKRTDITRPVTPHVLRHTFAVTYLKKGGQLRALQLLLGHDNIMTTQIYLSYTPQDVIADFNKTIEGKA